ATVDFNSNTVSVSLGGTAYPFGSGPADHTYATPQNPSAIAAIDYNGDGNLDLVIASDATILILFGDGHGNFSPSDAIHGPGGSPLGIFGADLNHDGKVDLIIGTSLGLFVMYN